MSNIVLSSRVRSNLLALQQTSDMMTQTQNRLATGKRVNSALDNPSNFFTAHSLNTRANDIGALMDSMGSAVKTIEAADNALKAITKTLDSMKAVARQAREDKTGPSVTPGAATTTNTTNSSSLSNNKITFDVGGGITASIDTYSGTAATPTTLEAAANFASNASARTIQINGANVTISANADLTQALADINAQTASTGVTAANSTTNPGRIVLTNASGNDIALGGVDGELSAIGFTTAANRVSTNGTPATGATRSMADIAADINSSATLAGKVTASVTDTGQLSLTNLTTSAIGVTGLSSGGAITGATGNSATLAAGTGGGLSDVRKSLMNTFNDLRTQLDAFAKDATFNGVNLLTGDKLKVIFNEDSSNSLTIEGKNADGTSFGTLNSTKLGVATGTTSQFGSDANLDTLIADIGKAMIAIRSQATQYGTSLSVVQQRQDFAKSMVNTLKTGADNLTLADVNEEAANMLALQTRQQLSSTALSLATQADQAVLRLF